MTGMISILFSFPRLDLWPRMWSILKKVPCALEKRVKLIVLGWNVLKVSIRSSWSIMSFTVCVSLLIFCLVDLSIVVSGVLKSPTIIVLLLISSFILFSASFRFKCSTKVLQRLDSKVYRDYNAGKTPPIWMSFSKLLSLSVPWFPHLKSGQNKNTFLHRVVRTTCYRGASVRSLQGHCA